jgi:3-deoxy-D-manno-octulosonic-acid transferase
VIEHGWRGLTRVAGRLPLDWSPGPRAERRADAVLHGASAGEVKAGIACLPALRAVSAGVDWLVCSGTDAGLSTGAEARLPRDVPRAVEAFFDRVRPSALVLVEADLWPNLLAGAAERSVPVGVLGARMSPRSLRGWRLLGSSARTVLDRVSAWAAASSDDAQRLLDVGVPSNRLRVTGWLKWSGGPDPAGAAERTAELDRRFSPTLRDAPLLVLGSIHPGELRAAAKRLAHGPLAPGRARWLAVARHGGRAVALAREGARLCPAGSFSLDHRFGVLRSWWGLADAALVGGGAAGRGVHDLLEPLAAGLRPLCFLDRGDPAGVGATLAALDLAFPLDRAAAPDTVPARDRHAFARIQASHDGRARGAAFLRSRGVLP